jgi:hypothetical protein
LDQRKANSWEVTGAHSASVALVAALPVLISYNKLSTSSDSANLRQIKLLGVLFIDEAQVLLTTLSNRFLIGTGDQKPSSLRY